MTGNRLTGPQLPQFLVGLGLDADLRGVYAKHFADLPADLFLKGAELRFFGDHHHVDIPYQESASAHHREDAGKQLAAVDALIRRVGIGKMLPDVPESGGPEQGVADGMEQNIRVGMAQEAFRVRDLDAARKSFLRAARRWMS